MAIPAIISLAKRLDILKNDNGISKNGIYEPFSYRFSNVFIDKKIGAATVCVKVRNVVDWIKLLLKKMSTHPCTCSFRFTAVHEWVER